MNLKRREFVKTATISTASIAGFNLLKASSSTNTNKIKVALIGCGGRGAGALSNFKEAAQLLGIQVDVVALADAFKEKVVNFAAKQKIAKNKCHFGYDAYHKVVNSNAEVVLLATPPNFRPIHFDACIQAGKHCFIEKPVAVDPPGARAIIASGEIAKKKGLTVVAGTQRRFQQNYMDMAAKVHAGAIGEIVGGVISWNMGVLWKASRLPNMSNADFLTKNWLNFREMSGDHICEQHVHQIDVANWLMGRMPTAFVGFGECSRREVADGNQFDFFSVDFDYGKGIHIHSQCRQIAKCFNRVGESFRGTQGYTIGTKVIGNEVSIAPNKVMHSSGVIQEHVDLLQSIFGNGEPLNDARRIAESTLCAIGARMSAYTGEMIRMTDLTRNEKSPHFNFSMAPAAIDFERGEVEMPDLKSFKPGRSSHWSDRSA